MINTKALLGNSEILLWHLLTVYPTTFFAQSLIRKKKWFRMNFFDRNFEDINVINDNEMTYLSRYLCRYLLTALELLSSTFRLCQQQL
jgi:hypothetical protein